MTSKDFRQQLINADLDIADFYSEDIAFYIDAVVLDDMTAEE